LPYLFEQLLARADAPQLAELMPGGAAKLLNAIDPKLAYPRNLVKVLLALRSPSNLLSDTSSRKSLLELLPRDQASLLMSLLGGGEQNDPYAFLGRFNFSRNIHLVTLFSFLGVGSQENESKELSPSDTLVKAFYPLFSHQNNALRDVQFRLSTEPHRVLLHMPTGSGKTRTAMNIIVGHLRERERAVVVWLAHSEELCQQAAAEFEKAWKVLGNRDIRVARYWGDFDSDLTDLRDGIVIAGLAKAFSRLKTDDKHFRALSSRAPLVVMDEAHQAVAPTYRQILELLVRPTTGAKLLGLTATPGRTWNSPDADELLSDFFARQKVTLRIPGYDNPVRYLIDEGYLATPKFRRIVADSKLELTAIEKRAVEETFDLPTTVLERLGRDEGRNLLIVFEIEKLIRRHHRLIVFASSVTQSDLLAAVLSARGHHAASVSSRSTPIERQEAIETYTNDDGEARILCNYGVLTTGFDAPRTSAALIARPTLSLVLYSQMIGRAMRGTKAGGNIEAEIVTVVDPSLPGFDSVESAFSNWEDVWKES
jgi:DNA repair protein RadD